MEAKQTLLSNQEITEEIKREIINFELSESVKQHIRLYET